MTKVLGYDLSEYDLVDHDKAPKMVVCKWNNGSLTLAPKYDKNQMFYSSVKSTDDDPSLSRTELEEMANEFNNDPDLDDEYKAARYDTVISLLDYITKSIEEKEEKLSSLKKLKLKLDKEREMSTMKNSVGTSTNHYFEFSTESGSDYNALISAKDKEEALYCYHRDILNEEDNEGTDFKEISSFDAWEQIKNADGEDKSSSEISIHDKLELFNSTGVLLYPADLL